MQNKMTGLFFMFVTLFSLQGFSQNTDKSEHPLLDKYYPQAQKPNTDTNKAITTQIKPATQTKPVSANSTLSSQTNKPAIIPTALPEVPPTTTTVGALTTTSAATTSPDATTIQSTTTKPALIPTTEPEIPPTTTTVGALTTTSAATTSPGTTTIQTTATKPVFKAAPITNVAPPPPIMDTRLGSSTKAYDTWQKNNNGAGSVTTSPK